METEELNEIVQEATEESTEEIVEQSEPTREEFNEKNMREMRVRKEQAEKERDEAYALLQKMKQDKAPKEQQAPEEDEDDDLGISEDDLVEGKHLRKVVKEFKQLKKELKNYQQATTSTTVETKLKQKYNDFDKVVSKENVEALVKEYPELGDTLRSNADLYSQAVSAYTMIKKMGIYVEDKFSGDRAKAEQNSAKPRPLASVSPQQGDSPLTRVNAFANGLTEELKIQMRKEMEEARMNM